MNNNSIQKTIWTLAVLTPFLAVWVASGLFSLITSSPLNLAEEFIPFLMQTAIVTIPFVLLAFVAQNRLNNGGDSAARGLKLSLALVVAGTVLFWGYYWFDAVSYQLGDGFGGANIGLGLLMLASPILISLLIPTGIYLGKSK